MFSNTRCIGYPGFVCLTQLEFRTCTLLIECVPNATHCPSLGIRQCLVRISIALSKAKQLCFHTYEKYAVFNTKLKIQSKTWTIQTTCRHTYDYLILIHKIFNHIECVMFINIDLLYPLSEYPHLVAWSREA